MKPVKHSLPEHTAEFDARHSTVQEEWLYLVRLTAPNKNVPITPSSFTLRQAREEMSAVAVALRKFDPSNTKAAYTTKFAVAYGPNEDDAEHYLDAATCTCGRR